MKAYSSLWMKLFLLLEILKWLCHDILDHEWGVHNSCNLEIGTDGGERDPASCNFMTTLYVTIFVYLVQPIVIRTILSLYL